MDKEEFGKSCAIPFFNEVSEYPKKICRIFEDFYGEERVDLQGLPSYREVATFLENARIEIDTSLKRQALLDKAPKENIEIVKTIILEALKENNYIELRNNPFAIKYIFPLAKDQLMERLSGHCFVNILVWFPDVTVTNEYNESIDIKDLYAKIPINLFGRSMGTIEMNRGTYTERQLNSGYVHSHVPRKSPRVRSKFTFFRKICMGTGPIRTTVTNLVTEYDEDLWRLLCLELDNFTKVESVLGGPYIKLGEVGVGSRVTVEDMLSYNRPFDGTTSFSVKDFHEFIKWLIPRKVLKFSLTPTGVALAQSNYDLAIKISNEFLKYVNIKIHAKTAPYTIDDLVDSHVLRKLLIKDGKFYVITPISDDFSALEGTNLFTFKGKTIKLHITEDVRDTENVVLLLGDAILQDVCRIILEIINYHYGRENRIDKGIYFI
jgi:hypothetical protein